MKRQPVKRNPVALGLKEGQFQPKVVKDKRLYDRKKKEPINDEL